MGDSNLDRMKRAVANKPAPKPIPPPQSLGKKANAQPPQPIKEKVLVELILFKCGHEVHAKQFRNEPCPACIKAKKQKQTAKWNKFVKDKIFRLPDGSKKTLTWNAATKTVTGCLSVPGYPEFWFTASSERKCFVSLHRLYVKHLEEIQAQLAEGEKKESDGSAGS